MAFDTLPASAAPFVDVKFKITVIDALMATGSLDLGEPETFLRALEGPQYDFDQDGFVRSDRA